jgi:diguanylate cyclase (GGDEF)-like protein
MIDRLRNCRQIKQMLSITQRQLGPAALHKLIVHKEIIASFALAILIFALAGVGYWGAAFSFRMGNATEQASALSRFFEEARFAAAAEESLERKYRLEPGAQVRERHHNAGVTLLAALRDARALAPSFSSRIDALVALHDDYLLAIDHMFSAIDAGNSALATKIDGNEVDPRFDALEEKVFELADQQRDLTKTNLDSLSSVQKHIMLATPIVLFLGLGLVGLCWYILFSGMVETSRLSMKLRESEREAWNTANTDALTSLANRHATLNLLQTNITDLKLGKAKELAVLLADLDGFKEVNDTYGHQTGDRLLQVVSGGFAAVASRFDASLSRLGGDEFALVIVGEGLQQRSKDISDALLAFLSDPTSIEGRIARVGASIGIVVVSEGHVESSDLLRRADVAMYAAKELGKNQHCFYVPELDAARGNRIAMAESMRHALAARAIQVAYQPLVDASTRRITGVEALARWQSTDGQWIAPDQFIEVAEEFGLIDELGKQVLNIACRAAIDWEDIKLSVNISPVQFKNPQFVETLAGIVDQIGLPRNRLELEITEGYIIEDSERAKSAIDRLHSLGFYVSLDDFGTGYSSIGYLRKFNFDKLKIDKSIVHGIIADNSARSIITATASFARSMNMTVTAEGVEAEDEVNLLRLAGCDTLQGYHIGRPQAAQSISDLLADQHQERIAG